MFRVTLRSCTGSTDASLPAPRWAALDLWMTVKTTPSLKAISGRMNTPPVWTCGSVSRPKHSPGCSCLLSYSALRSQRMRVTRLSMHGDPRLILSVYGTRKEARRRMRMPTQGR